MELEEDQPVQEGYKHVLVTPVAASRHAPNGERDPLIFVFTDSQFPRESGSFEPEVQRGNRA
jgi:hypothetical protein